MNILDIDLDFFQFGRLSLVPNDTTARPTMDLVQPWSIESTIEFLEQRCHLNKQNKIKGFIVEQHHELFHLWKQLIDKGQLTVPFRVYHVDAHADLGLGDCSWTYILGDLVHKPIDQRTDIPMSGSEKLNCGNYLAFSIANRWIDRLNFIINPSWRDDIHGCYVNIQDPVSYGHHDLAIQLKLYTPEQIDEMGITRSEPEPLGYEPEVPFEIIPYEDFNHRGEFDYIFLSKSPTYTTPATDVLIPVILEYMEIQFVF